MSDQEIWPTAGQEAQERADRLAKDSQEMFHIHLAVIDSRYEVKRRRANAAQLAEGHREEAAHHNRMAAIMEALSADLHKQTANEPEE